MAISSAPQSFRRYNISAESNRISSNDLSLKQSRQTTDKNSACISKRQEIKIDSDAKLTKTQLQNTNLFPAFRRRDH
jgi:hypothetical protein